MYGTEFESDLSPRMTRIVRAVSATIIGASLAAGAYVVGETTLGFPAPPWSAIGQAQRAEQDEAEAPAVDLDDFDFPEGWGPAVPPEQEPAPLAPADSGAVV